MADQEISISIPEPSFTLFDAKRAGKPEVIVVNDALLAFPHLAIFPWHLKVTIEMKDLAQAGMPAEQESEFLWEIGDEIENTVLSGRTVHEAENALFLARSTWDGIRELLFQVHDPELAHIALQQLMNSREWEREWEYQMEEDATWANASYVFQLFPVAKGSNA